METDISSVPLSELSTNPRLTPVEAVTIVRELALRVTRGTLPGVPSPHVIRVASAGTITVEGPVAADARTVAHAAHLLDTLLPGFDVPADVRVPGALRLIVARALGTLDLPVYGSLEKFTEALSRFAAEDPEDCIRELVARRVPRSEVESVPAAAVNASPAPVDDDITISDIRRARRATGLTLAEISERTGIPAPLLCELEWGYLQHWPSSHVARRLMVSYARAAGLDDELVVRTAWPLLEESIRARGSAVDSHGPILDGVVVDASSEIALPTERTTSLVTTHPAVSAQRARRRSAIVAALMIPALLLIGLSLGVRDDMPVRGIPSNVPMPAPASRQQPPAAADAASGRAPATLPPDGEGDVRLVGMPDDAAYSPTFASGGSAMFYHAQSNGHSALMRADTDSRGAVLRITSVLDDRARNFHARPSPDGRLIAFDSDRDGHRGVYVADVNGRNVRRLTGEGFAAVPSWSPDGRTLAFVRAEPDHPKVWNLWTMDLATGTSRRLTSHRVGQPWGGSWFPDGRRIAYSHEDRLIVLDLATGAKRFYRSPLKGKLVRTPAVSPDGTRVIFQVHRAGTWLLDFRTGAVRKVLADPSAEEYTWAPDGRRVAYHSRNAGTWGVWVMGERSITD